MGVFEPEEVVATKATNTENVLDYMDLLKDVDSKDQNDPDDDLLVPASPAEMPRPPTMSAAVLTQLLKRQTMNILKLPALSDLSMEDHPQGVDARGLDFAQSDELAPESIDADSRFFMDAAPAMDTKATDAPSDSIGLGDTHAVRARRIYAGTANEEDVEKDSTKVPVLLKKKSSTFHMEARKVFSLLDQDNDGFVTEKELSEFLNISNQEARALIQEAKIQLYGLSGANRKGVTMTFEEFTNVLTSKTSEEDVIPERVIKRYRMVFDSIDIDRRGVITPAQLAGDMGISNLEELGFEGKSHLTFDDFVKILRSAETGRAGRMMTKLLEDKEQGQLLADASEQKRKGIPGRLSLPMLPQAISAEAQILDEIWSNAKPDGNIAHLDNVKAALLEASSNNDINISDDDLMAVIMTLTSKVDANSNISYTQFLVEMRPLVETGANDFGDNSDESPRLNVAMGADSSDEEFDNPSDTLTPEEFDGFRKLFDDTDRDHDGRVTTNELRDLSMNLIDKHLLMPDIKIFFMQVLRMLEESGLESLDFEQFVVLLQEASDQTARDIGQSDWDAAAAMDSLKLIQLRRSRMSMKLPGSFKAARSSHDSNFRIPQPPPDDEESDGSFKIPSGMKF